MDLNLVILKGRLGSPPQLRNPEESNAQCSFVVGTSKAWHDKAGEFHERTIWHKVVAWGDLARACGKLRKGSEIFFLGEITERKQGNERIEKEVQILGFLRPV